MMKKDLSEVKGFENCKGYILHDDGSLYSPKTQRFLKPLKDSKGYLYYDLRRKKVKYKCPKVHRLVMLAFSNDEEKEEINHKDGNKSNNSIENLEWCDHVQNRKHAIYMKLKNEVDYGIAQYDLDGNLLRVYTTCRDALKALGKNYDQSGNIGRVVRGKRRTAFGFVWKQYEGSTTIPLGSTPKLVEIESNPNRVNDIV